MPQCAVATCRNSHRKTKGRRVRYHRFPAEEHVRERWVTVCSRSTIFNTTTARVCSLHFSAASYERDVEHEMLGLPPRSRLRRGAVPDLFVPVSLPSLIKKMNSMVNGRNGATANGHGKNLSLKGGKPKITARRRGASRVMTPTPPPSTDDPDQNHCDVLLALGLVPRNNNNNTWSNNGQQVGQAASAPRRIIMPMMDAPRETSRQPAAKVRIGRAASLDEASRRPAAAVILQENGEVEEAVSEGEGVARAAAALVTVKVDVEEGRPLVFHGDGTAAVKEEPTEAASSPGGSDEDDADGRQRLSALKRSSDSGESGDIKRPRRSDDEEEDDRERTVRAFVEAASVNGAEDAVRCANQLRHELDMLRALTEAKEREWNQLIRLRGLKEEMLVRLERHRTVNSMLGSRRPHPRQRPILPKPVPNGAQNSVIGEGRQGPILDVRSIIADYRSRHPEAVPRRGRRLKGPSSNTGTGSPGPGELSELGQLLNEAMGRTNAGVDSRPSSADSSRSGAQQLEPSISFKDVLVKFAKMSQSEQLQQQQQQQQQQQRLPYPEVTLHPVPPAPTQGPAAPSLLQGILSKPGSGSTQGRTTNFSPTLARLLTAPERPSQHIAPPPVPPVSIADLLGPAKGRTEITITPVGAMQPAVATPRSKKADVVVLDEEDSADRLVIDESTPSGETTEPKSNSTRAQRTEGSAEEEEEVPECQGCHRHQAQFVCAGCGNQWYCSRECQVSAWDDHSEVCSG